MQTKLQPGPELHLAHWKELQAESWLAKLPCKIETDRFRRILISPAPAFDHTRQVGKLIKLLNELLPEGEAVAETPVLTTDGVKVTDCAWLAPWYVRKLEGQHPAALELAPQICVEVLSPSNSEDEIAEKRRLYFAAGAEEVWICSIDGWLTFFLSAHLHRASQICPNFPDRIA